MSSLTFRKRITALQWARRLVWYVAVVAVVAAAAMQSIGVLVLGLVIAAVLSSALKAWQESARRQFIREARLPPFLLDKLRDLYPQLQPRDTELVVRGLRQFFMAHLRSKRQFVGMPSKVVDAAWHEFILHTQAYQQWCRYAFGGMLHHTPAEVLGHSAKRNDGLRRTWYWACKEESVDPRQPSRLPLLFALDAKFAIAGGFSYVPDCGDIDRAASSGAHCGTSFGDTGSDSGSGDSGGFGGSEPSSGDGGSSDSSSGSDGGSGCGGGGCGGGGGGD
ncbi:glycine-rich domain-containing protein [Variovorax sp. N23]|uniref:glycine-rich domain-containing protein n=1 Tax=Variovorax sp. N23 TaxID=2980555 RepID=UPI003966CE01